MYIRELSRNRQAAQVTLSATSLREALTCARMIERDRVSQPHNVARNNDLIKMPPFSFSLLVRGSRLFHIKLPMEGTLYSRSLLSYSPTLLLSLSLYIYRRGVYKALLVFIASGIIQTPVIELVSSCPERADVINAKRT